MNSHDIVIKNCGKRIMAARDSLEGITCQKERQVLLNEIHDLRNRRERSWIKRKAGK